MRITWTIILLAAALSNGFLTDRQIPQSSQRLAQDPPYNFTVKNDTFENYIDHFSAPLKGKYKELYHYVEDYWDKKTGPVILHLCGENQCHFPYNRQFPLQVAQHFNGLYIAIEHRYYGISQPTPDWSLKNLQYLNHEQAFADYAYFIESKNAEFSKAYGYTPKWVVIGGSYAGALSAWFRLKYPHLVAGALSSSGVVTPLLDFWQFDMQIGADFLEDSEQCYNVMKYYQQVAEDKLIRSTAGEREKFLKLFTNDTTISNDEFFFYFGDMPALFAQYSNRKFICDIVKKNNASGMPLDAQFQSLAQEGVKFGTYIEDYTYKKFRSTKIVQSDASRQWTYQYCTTYGWFQTPYASRPMRSNALSLDYWMRYCKGAFETTVTPKVNHTAAMFAAELIAQKASNIFFTQARNDPWRWVGINGPIQGNDKIEAGVMECKDCGHCRELYTPEESDPIEVKQMRERIIKAIQKWIQ